MHAVFRTELFVRRLGEIKKEFCPAGARSAKVVSAVDKS